MNRPANPYRLPGTLAPDLAQTLDYWRGLRRGSAEIPFWDDLNLLDLPDLSARVLLIDVFSRPERFRFNSVGAELQTTQTKPFEGEFLDMITMDHPLEFLRSQCSATVESRGPTFYDCGSQRADRAEYSRLLLPMWGDGRISMLLGVVASQ